VAGLAAKLAHVRHPLDLDDVIRSAEEDRENAKQRKRETEGEESSGAAWSHATRSLPANRRSPIFRAFALSRFRDHLSECIPG
jgi:hypothetical protein